MKSMLLLIALCIFSRAGVCQDLEFDLQSDKVKIPINDNYSQWEWGSNRINVIVLKAGSVRDTVLTTIGCSQWMLYGSSDSTILQICLWPLSFYTTDCALEDGIRPNPNDADLHITYVFKQRNIRANVFWKCENYQSEQTFSQINYQQFMPSICNLLQNGVSVTEIVHEVELMNNHSEYEYDEFAYWKDVIIHLLPLHEKNYYGKDINIITDCFKFLNEKYSNR